MPARAQICPYLTLTRKGPQMEDALPVPDLSCLRWFELSITATGEVAICCMDSQAEWPLDNVRDSHALDLYNQPAYRRLREQLLNRKALAPCKACTYL